MAVARQRGGDARRRREPRPRRAGQAADPSPLARRVGGALPRPRRLRARLAGRRRARGAAARLRHPPPGRDGAHVRRRPRRARVPRLRHAPSDRARVAAALARDPARLALGRGPRRRPVGRRGDGRAARGRRAGAAAGEHRQRRRGRARGARGSGDHRAARDARALDAGRPALGEDRGGPSRAASPHCHSAEEEVFVILEGTATLELWPREGERSRRRLCEPGTSSRVRPARASPTPSAPGRTA